MNEHVFFAKMRQKAYLVVKGLNQISKSTFCGLLTQAWDNGMTESNIRSGFKACGIYPYNPAAIPEEAFLPSEVTRACQTDPLPLEQSTCSLTVPVQPSSALPSTNTCDSTLPPLIPAIPDCTLRPIDNPEEIMNLILSGDAVVATTDENGIASFPDIPPSVPQMLDETIEQLFLPTISTDQIPQKNGNTQSIKSHRLLTTEDVVKEKRLKFEKQQIKKERKRETK